MASSNLKLFNQTITSPNVQAYLQNVLGEKKAEFVNNITALVSNNAQLQECEPKTLMFAALKATALDLPLDPNLGFAHVIPFKNNKTGIIEAQFQIGYKGIAQLSIRSGQFKTINVTDVREGELKGRDRRTGYVTIEWIEDEKKRNDAKVIGYLGYFKLLNGYEKESYWSLEELNKHGVQYSQTYKKGYGVWKDNFDAMAKKTVLKLMLNKGDAPMSVQMQQAIKYDQSVIIDEQGTARYIDNQKPDSSDQAAQFLEQQGGRKVEDVDPVPADGGTDGGEKEPSNSQPAEGGQGGDLFNGEA